MIAMPDCRRNVDERASAGFVGMRIVPRHCQRTSGNATAKRSHQRAQSRTRGTAADRDTPRFASRLMRGILVIAHLIQIAPWQWTSFSPGFESACNPVRSGSWRNRCRGACWPALALGQDARANSLPHFPTIDRNIAGHLEAQPHSPPANLKHRDFEHLLNAAAWVSNDHRFRVPSR